jgi:subtilase family serine protease
MFTRLTILLSCALFIISCQAPLEPEQEQTETPTVFIPRVEDEPEELPDLAFAYHIVRYTGECPWGGPGEVTMVIDNLGTADAGPFDVVINGDSARVTGGIPAGGQGEATVTFESGPVGSISAEADTADEIAESDETNNSFMIVFTPPPPCATPSPTVTGTPGSGNLPDLAFAYYVVTYTGECPWGGPGEVTMVVDNLGTADAGPFDVVINGETTRVTEGIPAGGQAEATITFKSGPVGGVDAEADPANEVMESNETNNTYMILFTPPPPCATPSPSSN